MKPRPFPASQWCDRSPRGSTPDPTTPPGRLARTGIAILIGGILSAAVATAESPPRARAHLQSVAEIAAESVSARGIGVSLSRATVVLRRQLGLRRGAGLVADEVTAGSAAARAGFIQHDVLVRLDDQILVLPEQFDALLESAEPGDQLACTVLRGGREVCIPLGQPGSGLAQAPARPIEPAAAQPLRTGGLRPTASSLAIVAPQPRQPSSADGLRQLGDETLVRQDPDFQIRLARGDETRLMVTDPAGRVVFQGVIDSADDRSRVPVAVRARVADMEKLLEPRSVAADPARGRVVPASAVAAPAAAPAARLGQLNLPPVELR